MTRKIFSGLKLEWFLMTILILLAPLSSAYSGNPKIKVMTRNLYLGADLFKVVEAAQTNPAMIPYAVAEVFQTMQYTNFPERAKALADEIAIFEPDVVGLQEVSTYYLQTPGDYIFGNPVQADTVVIDFYTVLDAELKARGMEYTAFTVNNADIEMPMVDPNAGPPYYLSDVRLVDHDVILVRNDHNANCVLDGNYLAQLELILGASSISFTRGYIAVDVNVKDTIYRFVNTHLEVRGAPGSVFRFYQSLQMEELMFNLSILDPKPIVMVGDFNSSIEDEQGFWVHPVSGDPLPYVPPYMQAVDAGYLDSWLLQRKYNDGFTFGFDEYVSDPDAELTSRFDIIFIDPEELVIDKVTADVVGDEVRDMTPSGFWPSDHAGVATKIRFDK